MTRPTHQPSIIRIPDWLMALALSPRRAGFSAPDPDRDLCIRPIDGSVALRLEHTLFDMEERGIFVRFHPVLVATTSARPHQTDRLTAERPAFRCEVETAGYLLRSFLTAMRAAGECSGHDALEAGDMIAEAVHNVACDLADGPLEPLREPEDDFALRRSFRVQNGRLVKVRRGRLGDD